MGCDPRRELRPQPGDGHRIEHPGELPCRVVHRCFLAQEPPGARIRTGQVLAQGVDRHGEHDRDGSEQDQPACRRGHDLGRGERDDEESDRDQRHEDDRLPPPAVEGDSDDGHQEQRAEPARNAARRDDEEDHRGGVEAHPDQPRVGNHVSTEHDEDGQGHEERCADPEVVEVAGAGRPRSADLTHDGDRGKRHPAGETLTGGQGQGRHRLHHGAQRPASLGFRPHGGSPRGANGPAGHRCGCPFFSTAAPGERDERRRSSARTATPSKSLNVPQERNNGHRRPRCQWL